MKTLLTTFAVGALAMAADNATEPKVPKDIPLNADKRLAVEKSRREFYQLQSDLLQAQRQLDAKAQSANTALLALKDDCEKSEGVFNPDALTCAAKPPAEAKK